MARIGKIFEIFPVFEKLLQSHEISGRVFLVFEKLLQSHKISGRVFPQ